MSRFPLVAGAAVILLAMTGCIEPTPPPAPSPTASEAPVFASEEEALAAAEAAYARYTQVEDSIAQEGGADPGRLAPLVTPAWLQHEVSVFEEFQTTGRRQIGTTKISNASLQQLSETGTGTAEIVVYVCVDFSATSFVDATGAPVASTGPPTATIEATFEASSKDDLLLAGSEPWPDSVC